MKNTEYKDVIKNYELKRDFDYIINKTNYLYTWYNLNIYYNNSKAILEGIIPSYIVINIYKKYINKIKITTNLKNNYTRLIVDDKENFKVVLEYIKNYNLLLQEYQNKKSLNLKK